MSERLSDRRLSELANHDAAWHRDSTRDERLAIVLELQRFRAMEKRLEEWGEWMEHAWPSDRWKPVAAELRNRMAGKS